MAHRYTHWGLAAVLATLFIPSPSVAGAGAPERWRECIARLTVELGEGKSPEYGFGVIVGRRGDRLYLITAEHVARPATKDEAEPGPSSQGRVHVELFSDQGHPLTATLLTNHVSDPQDLAILIVEDPSRSVDCSALCVDVEGLRRGTLAWYVGRKRNWYIPTKPGVVNAPPRVNGLFEVDFEAATAVEPGTSGAPLISERGILGMVLKDSPRQVAQALSIQYIQRLFEQWNYPWSLSPCAKGSGVSEEGLEEEQALMRAVGDGDVAAAERWSNAGVRQTVTNRRGYNLLMIAAEQRREGMFKWLLEKGVDKGYRNAEGNTPLVIAAGAGCEPCIGALLEAHIPMEGDAVTAVEGAAEKEHPEIISRLIKAGVPIQGDRGGKALFAAAGAGSIQSVRVLLDAGVNIDATLYAGITPLMAAADRGHLEVVKLLLARQANKQVVSHEGFTASSLAAKRGYRSIVQALGD